MPHHDPQFDLAACLRGDKSAWDSFVARYAGVIYSAVQHTFEGRLGGKWRTHVFSVEDAVQDVFLRLIKDNFRLLAAFDPQREIGRASCRERV